MSDSYEHGRLIRAIDELKDEEQYWFDRAMKAEARIAELELINQNYRLGGQHKQDDWLELIAKCERLDAALGYMFREFDNRLWKTGSDAGFVSRIEEETRNRIRGNDE